MLALRVDNKRLAVRKIAKPAADGEALIRVLLSGICNTDLEIARGYAGFKGTIGHEFVGVVEESSNQKLVGKRVVGEINAGCGECALCRAGDPRHCPNHTVLGIVGRDGAHAELLRLPVENLLPVPNKITDEHAVFTEPLAAACGIHERAKITKTDRVAVIGDGKLGLLCAQVVSLTGAPLLLVGKHESKLRIAKRLGIETTTPAKATARNGTFDVVIEASGAAPGFELALNLLRPKGRLILKSTFNAPTTMNASRIVVDEISIIGSRCGRFQPALDLLSRGAVDVESLISEEYRLSEGVHAMERAGQRGVLKVLLRPSA
jgi:threonine dehydrogenase-like Zn-dependent dehydrogenase